MKTSRIVIKKKFALPGGRMTSFSCRTIGFLVILLLTVHRNSNAQSSVLGFENWSNLMNSTYDSTLFGYYGIPNAKNGQPDGWNTYYGAYSPSTVLLPAINNFGVIKIDGVQAAGGSSAILLHTWYFYGRSTITYEDTISSLPVSITGQYKRLTEITINDTIHDGFSKGYAFILSLANDTLYKGEITLTDTNNWTAFQMNFVQHSTTTAPIERIFIAFVNDSNYRTCVEQGVCDLLWLDDVSINFTTTSLPSALSGATAFSIYPNPASGFLNITAPAVDMTSGRYTIMDYQGRVCQSGIFNNKDLIVPIENLNRGLYLIRLEGGNTMTTLSFQKE